MQMRLERDPERVKQFADQRQDANWAFRCFLKRSPLSSRSIDSIVHKHYRAVAAEIDCRQCADCCKAVRPLLRTELKSPDSEALIAEMRKFKRNHYPDDHRFILT